MGFFSPRLPSEMQWLESFYVPIRQGDIEFHFGKAANSRACGRSAAAIGRGRNVWQGSNNRPEPLPMPRTLYKMTQA
jgi:hypothetical protein